MSSLPHMAIPSKAVDHIAKILASDLGPLQKWKSIKDMLLDCGVADVTTAWICLKRWKKKCMGFQHKILNTWHHQGLVERTSGVTVEAGLGVDLHVNGGS